MGVPVQRVLVEMFFIIKRSIGGTLAFTAWAFRHFALRIFAWGPRESPALWPLATAARHRHRHYAGRSGIGSLRPSVAALGIRNPPARRLVE